MNYIFLDTNIYLNTYHYAQHDLKELHKIADYIDKKNLQIITTNHLQNEFWRNRDNKIKQAFTDFENNKINSDPILFRYLDSYPDYKKACNNFKLLKNKLLNEAKETVLNTNTEADKLIISLFEKSHCIEYTNKDIQDAILRMQLGNPPGKDGSYGDALNWILLLNYTKINKQKLYFVSDDGDYFSKIDPSTFLPILKTEWEKVCSQSEIIGLRSLVDLIKELDLKITLQNEEDRRLEINGLINSGNYATTHLKIAQIKNRDIVLQPQEAFMIFEAALTNSQICDIAKDEDVLCFLQDLVEKHPELLLTEELTIFDYLEEKNNDILS